MFSKTKIFGVALATCVALGVSACGADESKAPELGSNRGTFYVESKDDDTVIKGVTVIGRNGKCPKLTVIKGGLMYKDMEACGDSEEVLGFIRRVCEPLFDGNKLAYGERKIVYELDALKSNEDCPPKNGAYKVELDTNFGTYVYEIK